MPEKIYGFNEQTVRRIHASVEKSEVDDSTPGKGDIPRSPEGPKGDDGSILVEIGTHVGNGEYEATEVVLDDVGSTFVNPDGYMTFDGATGSPQNVIETNRATDVAVGTIVKLTSRGTANGDTRWFFQQKTNTNPPYPQLCYGTWEVYEDTGIPIEGELFHDTNWTTIKIHSIDATGTSMGWWVEQFGGLCVTIRKPNTSVVIQLECTLETAVGDFFTYDCNACDLTWDPLFGDGDDVEICIGCCPGGVTGTVGLQGPKGDKGDKGDPGDDGPQGPQGDIGPQGFQGSGIQGFQGLSATGTQGYQGHQGFQGLQGYQGFQGEGLQGPQGIQGIAGASGIQSVDTYDDGGVTIVRLVNDVNAPGDYTLYGFLETPEERGWKDIFDFALSSGTIAKTSLIGDPLSFEAICVKSVQGGATGIQLVNDEESPLAYTVYSKHTGEKGWLTLLTFFVNTTSISWSGGSPSQLQAAVNTSAKSSITEGTGGIELFNDKDTPGAWHVYSTDDNGTNVGKGWQAATQLTVVIGVQLSPTNQLEVQTQQVRALDLQSASAWTTVSGWSVTACS